MERGGEAVRGFIVCQVRDKKNDNWIRSQYVNVKEARRVSVEIEFVMRYMFLRYKLITMSISCYKNYLRIVATCNSFIQL